MAKEASNQREELKKQRNLYISKSSNLKKELKLLKNQSEDLSSGYKNRLPSPKTQGFLNENKNLQVSSFDTFVIIVDKMFTFTRSFTKSGTKFAFTKYRVCVASKDKVSTKFLLTTSNHHVLTRK